MSELTWDNFGAGYLGNLGEGYTELGLVAPPVTEEGAQDLYLKPSMLHSIASTTDHPEAAATLVNFLVNSPEAGAIFGTNRGLPASETMLEGAELDPLGQQIRDYEESIADRLGDAPPVPIVGYGTLEEKFRQGRLDAKTLVSAGNRMDIFVYLDRAMPDLERAVQASSLALGCTPIVNLFTQRCEPISLDHTSIEYRIEPDVRRPASVEVWSV